jgi:DnaJ domain
MIRPLLVRRSQRCFQQSFPRRFYASNRGEDPFRVLGIPRGSTYAEVKKVFLQLALQHHPDQQQNKCNDHNPKTMDHFVRIRQAFEVLREGSGETPSGTDPELQDLVPTNPMMFQFTLDAKTRQEIVDMMDQMEPGGLDSQGTWFMARVLANQAKKERGKGTVVEPPKQLPSSAKPRRKRK